MTQVAQGPRPAPAQPSPGAVQAVRQRLGHTYRGLNEVFAELPSSRLELKRRINSKLEFDPSPEQLQLCSEFARVADPDTRELCIRMLSVHLVLGQALGEFARTTRLEATQLQRSLELLPVLRATSRRLEAEFRSRLDAISRLHRDEVARLHARLERPDAPLQAALVLGPELARLAEHAAGAGLVEVAPSLSDDEVALIRESSRRPAGYDEAVRARLDGIAMRTLIEADLAAWNDLPEPGQNDTTALAERMELFRKLEQDKLAYRVAADRLNEARARNFTSARAGAGDIRATQQRLFAAYRTLNRVINAGPMHRASADEEQEAGQTASLRARLVEAERAGAEVDAEREAQRELVKRAVTGREAAEPLRKQPRPLRDLHRERKRRRLLIGIAVVLATISLVVNLWLYRGGSGHAPPTATTFEAALPVKNILPAMTILQAEVSTFLWDNMSTQERLAKVESIAQIAAQGGYTDIHLVNESQTEVARWSRATGVQLLGTPAAE